MLSRPALSIIVLAVSALAVGGLAARAADMPTHSKLGQIFVEPAVIVARPAVIYKPAGAPVAAFPWFTNSPLIPGYYGNAGDYYYRSYYGTSPDIIFNRLPYACWKVASCAY
jgi:hypothetical protein